MNNNINKISSTVLYDEWLPCDHDPTRAELQHMTYCHNHLCNPAYAREMLPLLDHIRYAMNLCRLTYALIHDYPTLNSSQPLQWKHNGITCNCIYFEVIRRSMDCTRRFIGTITFMEGKQEMDTKNTRQTYLGYTRSMIGVMKFIRDEALMQWTDVVLSTHHEGYTLKDADYLIELLRAYALWSTAQFTLMETVGIEDHCSPTATAADIKEWEPIVIFSSEAYRILQDLPTSIPLKGGDNAVYTFPNLKNGTIRF